MKYINYMKWRVGYSESQQTLTVECRCCGDFSESFAAPSGFEFTTDSVKSVIYPDIIGIHNRHHGH